MSNIKEKEYEIEIREILSRVQKVPAASLGEAIDKAMEMYYSEEIVLDAEDMKGVDFNPTEEELERQKEEEKEEKKRQEEGKTR